MASLSATNLAAPDITLPARGEYKFEFLVADGQFQTRDTVVWTAVGDTPGYLVWRASHFSAAELADPAVSGDSADPDADGQGNLAEFRSGTHPRDRASVLSLAVDLGGDGLVRLRIAAVAGRTYAFQFGDAVAGAPWSTLQSIPAGAVDGPVSAVDLRPAAAEGFRFYRVITPAP